MTQPNKKVGSKIYKQASQKIENINGQQIWGNMHKDIKNYEHVWALQVKIFHNHNKISNIRC